MRKLSLPMYTRKLSFIIILAISSLLILSCSNDDNANDPVIVNQNNNFSFELSNASNITNTFEYNWKNSSSIANIGISTTAQATQMDVKVFDALNNEVYSNSLDNNGNFVSNPGSAGLWKIRIIMKNFNGNIRFTVKNGN